MMFKNIDVTYQPLILKITSDPVITRRSSTKTFSLFAQVNYPRRSLEFFILVCFCSIFPSTSAARLTCESTSPNSAILDIGTITWPAGISVGGTIKTLPSQHFSIACRYTGDPVSADVTNYVDVLSHSATDGGSNDVFSTNQPGAGIRYSFSAPDCSVTDPILKKDTVLRLACLVPGNMARTFIIDVTPSLIATGAPVSAGSFTSAAIIDLTYIHTDTSSLWPQKPMYSGVAQGVLVPSTCSVLSPALNVPMPNISTQAFEGGIGAVSSITPFALKYRCSAGAQLYLTLTDNTAPTNRTDILTLAPDSTASGVSIQITNDSGPISFGPDSAEAGVVNQWKVGASPDGTLDIPLHARYVRTAVITPGSVKARATFTMSFQ